MNASGSLTVVTSRPLDRFGIFGYLRPHIHRRGVASQAVFPIVVVHGSRHMAGKCDNLPSWTVRSAPVCGGGCLLLSICRGAMA